MGNPPLKGGDAEDRFVRMGRGRRALFSKRPEGMEDYLPSRRGKEKTTEGAAFHVDERTDDRAVEKKGEGGGMKRFGPEGPMFYDRGGFIQALKSCEVSREEAERGMEKSSWAPKGTD